ncbi:MAG: hypothetical protein COX65_07655 [Elusimicrobia bacterium CG_4_10_14_0_2_um_filter_56_8]|nr:MAG: hypothetical protein COX65_07655 [Elusimicrobia bacterium CG_4_10_14_0_2_um_filter_56_8]
MVREYYSIPEAAARLGLSRIAVFKRVKKGRLPAIRFGRNWAISAAALERASLPIAPARIPAPENKSANLNPPPAKPQPAASPPSPDSDMDSMGWD